MKCPRCQAENRGGRRFCAKCGASLALACPACGFSNEPGEEFCGGCGRPLSAPVPAAERFSSPQAFTPGHLAEKILTSRSALEGERKQVTVLFCDLANSTALAERLGPEAMHALLNGFFELALAEVHRYEGTINQFLGDGFMALFGAPLAHEDHARRAVLAALGIQRALRERHVDLGQQHGAELSVRMGLNTGPVVVGKIGDNLRMDYTAVGDTTNLAARLQQAAEPGTILVSEATVRQVAGYVHLEALEPIQVKGKAGPVAASKVLGLLPRRSPLEARGERAWSRFVGRERELTGLRDLLEQAEQGQGQVVGLVGEPGVGKSRLLFEFRQRLAGKAVTYLEGRCLSYGSAIPYLPVLDIVRNNCGIAESDTPEGMTAKVRSALEEVGMDPDQGAPYLLHLLGVKEGTQGLEVLTPEAIKTRTFETLRQLSLKGSRRRPIVFAVEDLHWIDRTSEEFFVSLIESLVGAPILSILTYRPGYRPPWIEKSYVTQMALRPLSSPDSRAVVQSLLTGERVPDSVVRLILERAEGNPFFLEELSRAVGEHGALGESLTVPDTVQGVLMARIDRLPDATKRALQTASVLGREFSRRLLEDIWDEPEGLDARLAELKRLEFLYDRSGGEEPAYVFKHALTQEVAHDSLLTPQRRALHAAAGRALETLFAGRLEEIYDRLAHHYARTDDAAKAVEYLSRFADRAARGHAHVEAIAALHEAVAHAERLPADDRDRAILNLILRQVESLYNLGRFQAMVDLLLQQQGRLERLRDPLLAARHHFQLGMAYSFLGDRDRAAPSVMQAFAEAAQCGDEATMGKAKLLAALERFWVGQYHDVLELSQGAIALLEGGEERYFLGMAYWGVGSSYAARGEFESALEASARAQAIAEATGDRRLHVYASVLAGWIYAQRGEWEKGIEACQRALDVSPSPFETAWALGFFGYAHLEKGDRAQAIGVLQQAVEQASLYRSRQVQVWFKIFLSEAYLSNGQVDAALDPATEVLEIARSVNFMRGIGLACRALGRIAQARGAATEAENQLNEALKIFASIDARYDLGRTRLDLARLAHAQGKREAVETHIKEAHSLFTALPVPRWRERTEQLARELGFPLSV
jgi:class 3 adenylate cyclase/tetratricopeptide (TPR) repeat protein